MNNHLEATFDPYHVWLGIPPAEQPPDNYRLLGIARFEENLEVIESAADRQMAHVRSFQNGSRAKESQRLLNQIASARVCLLGATAKQKYDESLRREAEQAIRIDNGAASTRTPLRARRSQSAKRRFAVDVRWKPIVAWTACAALLGVGCMLFALNLKPKVDEPHRPISSNEPKQVADAAPQTAPQRQVQQGPEQPEQVSKGAVEQIGNGGIADKPVEPREGFADLAAEFDALASLPQKTSVQEGDVFAAATAQQQPESKEKPGTAQPSRLPLPTDEELRAAEIVLTSENSDLLKHDGRQRSAKELLDLAKSAKVAPAVRYRLFEVAAERAVDDKNIELALLAVDEAAVRFELDAWQRKFAVVQALHQGLVPSSMLNPLLNGCRSLISEALAAGRFERGADAGNLAMEIGNHPQAGHLRANARLLSNYTRTLNSQHSVYRNALSSLRANPADPAAHTVVGRWLCFVVDDWPRGLPHLSQGVDYSLAQAAKLDLAASSSSAECAQAGDFWWDLAEGKPASESAAMKRRALHWYDVASTQSENSLADVRIRQRMDEARRLSRPFQIGGEDVSNPVQPVAGQNSPK